MNTIANMNWNPLFYLEHPLFYPISNTQDFFQSFATWPSLSSYNRFLSAQNIQSKNNKPIHFVPQAEKPKTFEQHYEPRIFLNGEIQTREHSWHDFFQVLIWNNFPKTKNTLNYLHYKAAVIRNSAIVSRKSTPSNRSPVENAITLFDECGSIVVSRNNDLLSLIRNAQWKELFWNNRARIQTDLKIFVFGHALYEKSLNPYIGMTSHSILLTATDSFFAKKLAQKLTYLDEEVSSLFAQGDIYSPKMLTPIPVLGYPEWHVDNKNEKFYDNKTYFRETRHKP